MKFEIIENLSEKDIYELYNNILDNDVHVIGSYPWYSYVQCFYGEGRVYYVYGCTSGNNSCASCSSYNCGCCESACTKGSSLNKGGSPQTTGRGCYSHTIYAQSRTCS